MKHFILLLFVLTVFYGCEEEYSPKPRAYPRMELPAHEYVLPEGEHWDCPYVFEFSKYSFVTLDPRYRDSTCWYNIYYPGYRATIHLTYYPVVNLARQIEENRKLAMKHIAKATQINESLIDFPDKNVYGIVYDFRGETASDLQFFLTDSTNHLLRGALYFNVTPNKDSLAPVIEYVKEDIDHMISSFTWTGR